MKYIITPIILSLLFVFKLSAVELAPLFADHMVLQRDQVVTLSGTAKAKSTITIRLGKFKKKTRVDKNGHWKVKLPAHSAGGPHKIFVSDNKGEKLTLDDIYFGDVWLASGQSNMEWKMKWQVDNHLAEIKDSKYPLIRYFDVKNHYLAAEQSKLHFDDSWKLASPDNSPEFSAVAWFFAKRLHTEKNIPIGIIDSSWGGTPAEAWTPLNELVKLKGYKDSAQGLIDEPKEWDKIFEQTREDDKKKYRLLESKDGHKKLQLSSPIFDDSNWTKTDLPLKKNLSDFVWARKHIDLNQSDIPNEGLEIQLGHYPQPVQLYFNGQPISQKEGEQKGAPYLVPKSFVKAGENLIAVRGANAWNNQTNIGRKGHMFVRYGEKKVSIEQNWRVNNTIEGSLPMPPKHWQKTSVLYNAMIHPIIHYPLKGVIWYQGESNDDRASEYRELFTTMITSWRERWGQPNLPFIFAQLANIRAIPEQPVESEWAELREAQTQSLALNDTAMVVLIDAGEKWDIHPRNKQIVAERMHHAANAIAYGQDIIYSGPKASGFVRQGDKLIVSFDDVGYGLKIQSELQGFEIAGEDGVYKFAQAEIANNKVILRAKGIDVPKSIRYAWADNTHANLYNLNGFPAIPFRLGE